MDYNDYQNEFQCPEEEHAETAHPGLLHNKRVGRELAMKYLFQCDLTHEKFTAQSWELFCAQAAEDLNLPANRYGRKCREYAEKLLQAVIGDLDHIDATIREFAKNWSPERLSAVDRNIIRVAIGEMYHFPDVPPVVSIDEAVAITKDYSDEHSCDFINGILNAVKDTLDRPAREAVKA